MYKRLDSLQGQVAVITGGAGGMGYATAQRLAERGARVIGIIRSKEIEAIKLYEALPNPFLKHFVINCSIDNTASIKLAVERVQQEALRCDILVNTAGITKRIPLEKLEEMDDDTFDEIMRVNVRGTYAVIREFAPLLKRSNQGLIVNISSAAGIKIGGSNLAYAASKAAIDSLTRNLSKVLAPNVRVVSIAPSAVNTKFLADRPQAFFDNTIKSTPLNRVGEVDDVACAIEALATTMRFVTGNTFSIDGGRTI